MSLNIFIADLDGALLSPRRETTVSSLWFVFDHRKAAESGIPAARFYYTWTLKNAADLEESGRKGRERKVVKQTFRGGRLHLSFYGHQRGPSLPLMALTAYSTALHRLALYYSPRFLLPKWTRVCASAPQQQVLGSNIFHMRWSKWQVSWFLVFVGLHHHNVCQFTSTKLLNELKSLNPPKPEAIILNLRFKTLLCVRAPNKPWAPWIRDTWENLEIQ